FHDRLDVIDGQIEDFQRIFAALGLNLVKRAIDDALGNRLLAGFHQHVHKLGHVNTTELGIGQNFAFRDFSTAWHLDYLSNKTAIKQPWGASRRTWNGTACDP